MLTKKRRQDTPCLPWRWLPCTRGGTSASGALHTTTNAQVIGLFFDADTRFEERAGAWDVTVVV